MSRKRPAPSTESKTQPPLWAVPLTNPPGRPGRVAPAAALIGEIVPKH
jgi:hypothetical protein